VADLFATYAEVALGSVAWDEMIDAEGAARPASRALHDALQCLTPDDLVARSVALARAFADQGVTFSLSGEERPFPLDLVPRVIAAEEWATVERGVVQRVRALEAFLADVYGEGRIFAAGVVPRRLIATSKHFHRPVHGIEPPNGVRAHVTGIDLVRDTDGEFRVLEDNLRVPSGVSYVIENRQAMGRVFPELFATERVRAVAAYPSRLLRALCAAAPRGVEDPTVVVLTPGVYNAAYFEHSMLARLMGVELVEGRDLTCRDGVVYMRSVEGMQRVDVIYRRIDDEFLDPLHFRPDSLMGCPGVLGAAREGRVVIANAVGNGVADDKLTFTYVPAFIRYYLGEEPVLRNVETYRLEVPDQLAYVLRRLDELVLKPVDGSGGEGIVIGPQADGKVLDRLRAQIVASPRGWIAQPVVTLSTVPTLVGETVVPRHVDLRPFAVNSGDDIWVLPGGLTRVALREGSLVVNSSQGGGSKDTWVLADTPRPPRPVGTGESLGQVAFFGAPTLAPNLDPGPRYAQSQQQQQGRRRC
jgi:uncharacterized circularly permuted ATP-grasp superfamily protein